MLGSSQCFVIVLESYIVMQVSWKEFIDIANESKQNRFKPPDWSKVIQTYYELHNQQIAMQIHLPC